MSIFAALLEVQRHDTSLSQLHHRRTHLPEHAAVVELEATLESMKRAAEPLLAQEVALSVRQNAFEAQLHDVDAKIVSADRSLFGGTVTATRELQAFEADLVSLRRRRSELEDHEIDVLMEREPVDAAIAASLAQQAELADRLEAARTAESDAAAALDRQVLAEQGARAEAAASAEATLLARYESIRSKNGGVGIARIEGGSCGGCRLKIAAVEIDRIRGLGPDTVITCEECGALLVR